MRLLLVEDDKSILTATAKGIEKSGYSVDICGNGPDAQSLIFLCEYDCIILDIMLPGIDGLTILKNMRNKGNQTPVLLLTAKDTVADRVKGLDCGADDYMIKPFSLDELMARLRALMRRQSSERKNELSIADLTVDLSNHCVRRADKELKLTSKEFAILEYLLRNKNRLLTRTQIVDHVWNYDFDCSSNIVDVYIRYLREKIDDGFEKKLIGTVRGSGYIIKES
ncbi:MAG: DNA-binding response regulator [Firmicutes bacterium HGW-Firmicutes-16]|nr:MAG: DNA-binding response regulator [Firmicutes bacterium HGW-Firmicutes-16]